ncbi:hypothetical protein FSARC_12541 [Fusarium sarcochroum]|uniref:Uncharacterized protein n=1 Tax=Fusarium sarcochroum TaxID=1208366 RepID=A0A8H4T7T8_9HYPO|nr:hypothetical protein FSARC_12541 [Fusarium sarcochroum]
MSLATVVQDSCIEARELIHKRNPQEGVHTVPRPLRSCLNKPAPTGINLDKKDSGGSSTNTKSSKDGMNFEKSLQKTREPMVLLETRRLDWKEEAFMPETSGHGIDNDDPIIADSDELLPLLDGVTSQKEVRRLEIEKALQEKEAMWSLERHDILERMKRINAHRNARER